MGLGLASNQKHQKTVKSLNKGLMYLWVEYEITVWSAGLMRIWGRDRIQTWRQKRRRPRANCSLHSKLFAFQSSRDFWAKRALQGSGSAINFLADDKICLFAPIQTGRKNHQCSLVKYRNFGLWKEFIYEAFWWAEIFLRVLCFANVWLKCLLYIAPLIICPLLEKKIPKRWYTRPCRTDCMTGTG